MSCNFNPITCKNCPKYNNCLLQIVYANTLTLADMISSANNKFEEIDKRLENIVMPSFSTDDNVEMFSNLDNINNKMDNIAKILENNEEVKNENTIDINNIQSSLTTIDSKLNDLIKSYNSYEYIPMVEKD